MAGQTVENPPSGSTLTPPSAYVLSCNFWLLAADAGRDSKVDAIEACFRRCGYSNYGWGRGYGSCYGSSCFRSCYRPYYSYTSYCCSRPLYYTAYICQPVCQYYWGCY